MTAALCLAVSLTCSVHGDNGVDGTSAGKTDAVAEEASQAAGSNTVVVVMGSGFPTLDPGYIYERYPPFIVNACYENLFKLYGNDNVPEPCLANTYEFSEDDLTLTVKLKQNATFASGNPMASTDVLFGINRCKSFQGNPSLICDTIESMEAPDDYAMASHLIQADSAILSKLTYSFMAILGSAVVKEHGGTDTEGTPSTDAIQPYLDTISAGSGMYVMISYIPDQEVISKESSNYWGEATNANKFIIKIQPDANTQVVILSGRDIDVAVGTTSDTMSELEGAENISVINGAAEIAGFVMTNMDEAYGDLMSNPQIQNVIRGALDYIDIRTICDSGTIILYDIIQAGSVGSKGEGPADYANLEGAEAPLAEARYSDGSDVGLTVTDLDVEGILLIDLAQKIKDDLSQVGIDTSVMSQPWAAGYGGAYRDGTPGFTVVYWGTDYNDPNVQSELLPDGVVGKRAGRSADMDLELAVMYERTMSTTDNDARIVALEEVQDTMYKYGSFIMAAQASSHVGYNTRLGRIAVSDPYALDLILVHVK